VALESLLYLVARATHLGDTRSISCCALAFGEFREPVNSVQEAA
jgi:hypothetical protein